MPVVSGRHGTRPTLKTCRQFLPLSFSRLSSISMISTKSFLAVSCEKSGGLTDYTSIEQLRSSAFRTGPRDRSTLHLELWSIQSVMQQHVVTSAADLSLCVSLGVILGDSKGCCLSVLRLRTGSYWMPTSSSTVLD
jgi:hypothetical protein